MNYSSGFYTTMEEDFWAYGKSVLYVAALAHVFFFALFVYIDVLLFVFLNIASIVVYIICVILLKYNNHKLILFIAHAEVILHALCATYFLGIQSGFHYYIYILIVVDFIRHQSSKNRKTIGLFFLVSICLLINEYFSTQTPLIALDHKTLVFLHYFNLVGFCIIGFPIINLAVKIYTGYKKQLYEHAVIDPLTRLYNRRHLESVIEYVFSKREDNATSIIMIDIDHFKSVNDVFGHQCGDVVLQSLAKTIQNETRKNDTPSRWGGEEFVILLPSISLENAVIIAERIRAKIQELDILCPENRVIKITLTAGVVARQENESFQLMLERADVALYRGKNEGRNRIVAA